MNKLFCIGEILIDFIPNEKGLSIKNVPSFQKMPGGAPANVAVAAAKLGGSSVFLGKISNDDFGNFLMDELFLSRVDISKIVRTDNENTALAFVSLDEHGERSFVFYRDNCADIMYNTSELDENIFSKNDILHFCSVDLVDFPIRKTHIKAINAIKSKGGLVSFDLNIRSVLWKDHQAYREVIMDFISYADIIKTSFDDLAFLLKTENIIEMEKFIFSLSNSKISIFTNGNEPVSAFYKNKKYDFNTFKVNVKDSTGAGDSFMGAFLFMLLKNELLVDNLLEKDLNKIFAFANAAGAITVSNFGAMNSMPAYQEVELFIKNKS